MRTTKSAPKEVRKVIRACAAPIKARLHATSLIACGAQGCTYKTSEGNAVVKVSAGYTLGVTGTEAERYRWIKKLGWAGGHTALPRTKGMRIFKLDRCARGVGVKDAYVIVRESLNDIPRSRAVKAAIRVLERMEDLLFDLGSNRRFSARQANKVVMDELRALPVTTQRLIAGNKYALATLFQIAHLQVWLARHKLTMGDIKRSNLGVRCPGLLGDPFDIVVRDIGVLEYHTAGRRHFYRAPAPPRLGGLGGMDAVARLFVIASDSERGYWSNRQGWVYDARDANRWPDTSRRHVNLPLSRGSDARWVEWRPDLPSYAD